MKNELYPKEEKKKLYYIIRIIKNTLAVIVLIVILIKFVEPQQGYNWVYNDLLKSSMESIKKYKDLTMSQRYELKLGFSYSYLQYIKQNTPDSAVIIYPDYGGFYPPEKKSPFKGDIPNKLWATRFLYPRKLVYFKEIPTSPFKDRITHIAIVNGIGLDKINIKLEKPIEFGIIPISLEEKNK